jgi:hypothetical protein
MCHGNVSSTVPPQALSSSVALTVRESGEHESDQDCEVIGGKETAIAHEEVQRLANQTVNAPRQEGPRSEASQKKLRAP